METLNQYQIKVNNGKRMCVKAIGKPKQNYSHFALILADTFLSLPSGYTAGDHEITIEEALDLFGKIVTDYPSYPHIGYYGGRRISHDRA